MKRTSVFLLLAILSLSPPHVAGDDQPHVLADLLMDADGKRFAVIFPKFKVLGEQGLPVLTSEINRKLPADANPEAKEKLAKRQANAAVALLLMNQSDKVWPHLKHSPDPTLRSYLIERLGPGGVYPRVLIARLEQEQEVSVKRAILLSLGGFDLDRLSLAERRSHLPLLLQLYRDDPDPGIHGAAEWLLRQWHGSDDLKAIDKGLATGKIEGIRKWYVNRQGQTMVVIPKPGEFWMGEGKERHRMWSYRSYAIASKKVTVDQFLRFRKEHEIYTPSAPTGDCPVNQVSWYDAAAYCNWLSEQEGIPQEQWCYQPDNEGKYAVGMTMAPDYLQRTGYRLPTEAEWEYSCRAGAATSCFFGESGDLLVNYAWYGANSLGKSHPVGLLKSNDLGLFDMHGNDWEWCQDAYKEYGKVGKSMAEKDINIVNNSIRAMRGGSFFNPASDVRSANRISNVPSNRGDYYGIRVARTFAP